jgi:hypothetical protein
MDLNTSKWSNGTYILRSQTSDGVDARVFLKH